MFRMLTQRNVGGGVKRFDSRACGRELASGAMPESAYESRDENACLAEMPTQDAIDSIREYTRDAIGIAVPSIQAKYPEQAPGNLEVRADIALPVVAMGDIIMISNGGSETGESRCLTSLFGA